VGVNDRFGDTDQRLTNLKGISSRSVSSYIDVVCFGVATFTFASVRVLSETAVR
jgi:hypothetical protein